MELLCINLEDYKNFVINMKQHKEVLNEINKNLKMISPFGMTLSKINQTGHIMKTFYTIYRDEKTKNALEYSFDFCGYLDNLRGFQNKINEKFLGKCKFANSSTAFEEGFHPLVGKNVKNNYKMRKHMLITGPNAGDNILENDDDQCNLSTNWYVLKQAVLNPYDCIHSILTFPILLIETVYFKQKHVGV